MTDTTSAQDTDQVVAPRVTFLGESASYRTTLSMYKIDENGSMGTMFFTVAQAMAACGACLATTPCLVTNLLIRCGAMPDLTPCRGAGNDTLYGGAGNDVIIGGKGRDELYGGEGADVFLFKPEDLSGSEDVVADLQLFGAVQDAINLSQLGLLASGQTKTGWLAANATQSGNDVVLNLGNGTLTLSSLGPLVDVSTELENALIL